MACFDKNTFDAAADACAAKSSDLVSIHDAAENAFVETLVNEGPSCPDDGSGSWTLDSQVRATQHFEIAFRPLGAPLNGSLA